jgi:DNA-binding MarR family transcriptional regulator
MQKRGLVSRERCATDQRGAVVSITPRGRDLITAAAPQHVASVRDVFIDQLTKAELKSLIAIGDKVRKRLAALENQARTE